MDEPLPLSVLEFLLGIDYKLTSMVISEIVRLCRGLKESVLVVNSPHLRNP